MYALEKISKHNPSLQYIDEELQRIERALEDDRSGDPEKKLLEEHRIEMEYYSKFLHELKVVIRNIT